MYLQSHDTMTTFGGDGFEGRVHRQTWVGSRDEGGTAILEQIRAGTPPLEPGYRRVEESLDESNPFDPQVTITRTIVDHQFYKPCPPLHEPPADPVIVLAPDGPPTVP